MSGAEGDANDRTVIERRDPLVGTMLDQRFRIDFALAAGGFGAIYLATDVPAGTEVALKVLHPRLARDPMVVARFRREGATLATLRDPHTVTAYELGEAADGTLYIVMELLHGESLYQRFRARGPLPWRRVVHIARGVCSSLAEAHAAGIVHRDLKPANIHLENRGDDPDFVKVLDFGIAKIIHGNEQPEHPWGPEGSELTQAGQMVGTVDYMSPEQMVGGELTGSSDIYTLGVVMYEMITGRTPFADEPNATAILTAVLTQRPDPLSHHAAIPPRLEQIITRCLEHEPDHRFHDIAALGDALAEVAAEDTTVASPPIWSRTTLPLAAVDRAAGKTEVLARPGFAARNSRQRERHPAPARGSQHAIDVRGLQPMMDTRGDRPLIDRGSWHRPPPRRGSVPPVRPGSHPLRAASDVAAPASRAATMRWLIWLAFLVVAIAVIVAATR